MKYNKGGIFHLKVKISDINIGENIRGELGDLTSLKESIKQLGLLEPIGITAEHELLYGLRRLQACKELGWQDIPVIKKHPRNQYEKSLMKRHENTERLPLTWQEDVIAKKHEKDLYEREFPETKQGSAGASSRWYNANEKISFAYTHIKAKLENKSRRSVEQDIQLAEAMEKYPQLANAKKKSHALRKLKKLVISEKRKVTQSKTAIAKKEHNIICADYLKTQMEQKFDLIIADPPYGISRDERFEAGGRFITMNFGDWDYFAS